MAHRNFGVVRLTIFGAILLGFTGSAFGQAIQYEPTRGVPTFAVREPVLRLKPGATVETRTFSKPGDYYDPHTAGPWPGEVGPFFRGPYTCARNSACSPIKLARRVDMRHSSVLLLPSKVPSAAKSTKRVAADRVPRPITASCQA